MLSSEKNEKDRLYEVYLEKAVYVAQLNRADALEYIDSDEFQAFDTQSQNIILHMVDLLEGEDLSLAKNNASLKKRILKNTEIQAEFASVMTAMSHWKKWIRDPAHVAQGVLDSTAEHYPYPPIDWAVGALSHVSSIVGAFGQNQLRKYTLSQEPLAKTSNIPKLLADLMGMTGILLNFFHPATPLIAMVSPILLMVAAAFMAGFQIRNCVKSIKNLIQEIKQKEPKETYKLRVRKRVIECVKEGATALFYIAFCAVAVAQFVSIFTNPISLGVFIGISAGVGIGMVITNIVTHQLRKRTEARLLNLENELGLQSRLAIPKPGYTIGKGLKKRVHSVIQTLRRASKTLPNTVELKRPEGLHALHVAKKMQSKLMSPIKIMTLDAFNQLHNRSVEYLEQEKQQIGSLYEGIQYKSKTIMGEKRALLVDVPREVAGAATGQVFDCITRSQNAKNEVEMTLSLNPTKKSIEIFLDMHRDLAPLRMDYCGDQKTVADILEISKKLKIEVQLDERDLELVKTQTPNPLHL